MPPRKTTDSGSAKALGSGGRETFASKKPKSEPQGFQSELALEIIGELYPLLLENCTDEDDEIDTQAVFDVLAGLMGLFTADYAQNYGEKKAIAAFKSLVELAMETYQERAAGEQA